MIRTAAKPPRRRAAYRMKVAWLDGHSGASKLETEPSSSCEDIWQTSFKHAPHYPGIGWHPQASDLLFGADLSSLDAQSAGTTPPSRNIGGRCSEETHRRSRSAAVR